MDLNECKQEIVNRGFPELKHLDITVGYSKLPDAYFEFTRYSRSRFHIDVCESLRHSKKAIILGGMSHEIAHIKRETKMGTVLSMFDEILYNNFPRYEKWDERSTDLLAVERGLGPELLEFLRYADERRERYISQDGLTVKELESILKNM